MYTDLFLLVVTMYKILKQNKKAQKSRKKLPESLKQHQGKKKKKKKYAYNITIGVNTLM